MPRSKALIRAGENVGPLSLIDLCRISGCSAEWILELVEEGILEPFDLDHPGARFDSSCIATVRRVQRLQGDLRINLPGIAVVLSLVEENARLKRLLQHFEDTPPVVIRMPANDR